MRQGKLIAGAGLAAGAAFALAPGAEAATFEVDNASDAAGLNNCTATPGDCSLPGALDFSNLTPAVTDTITFSSAISGQTIGLSVQQAISDAVTITGPGADRLTISGNDNVRIFNISTPTNEPVTISGLTLRDGDSSLYMGNANGGAIRSTGADLTLDGVAVLSSTAYDGGGIWLGSNSEDTTIVRSLVSGNTAPGTGGISAEVGGAGYIINSTISGNDSLRPIAAGLGSTAGGLHTEGYTYIYSSTIVNNTSNTWAGGVSLESIPNADSDGFVSNSIIANNTGTSGGDLKGNVQAEGSLVESQGTNSSVGQSGPLPNLVGIDPQLGPLGANGGTTPTHKPSITSPVIDKGFSTLPGDQRSFPRLFDSPSLANATGGNGVDMGAFELQAADFVVPVTPTPTPPKPAPCKKKKKKGGKGKGKKSASAAACKRKKKKRNK